MSEKPTIEIPEEISVRALAAALGVDPTKVIGKLVAGGVMATINQSVDFDTATLIAEEFGFTTTAQTAVSAVKKTTDSKSAVSRPPIVTIMGHVDHGKTSLLDFIRRSNIAASETGGITQHISAYQINFATKEGQKRKITFVDTPGHEAFSALRSHGATLTDIVILVVAADDGIKPQTVEAINHARSANVPIIVAVNKTDLPGANIERVKQQLSEHELVAEDWGGKTIVVPVSAKNGQGVEDLLEMVILTADLLELKADADATPEGIVIEANLDKQVGPIATVLVYNGTLHPGQVIVIGKTYGRIRALQDDLGARISSAGPAKPAIVTGLKDVPNFGERLEAVPNEKVARTMTQAGLATKSAASKESDNTFRVILKADVGGSLAALEETISKLKTKDATVEIISSGIGQVNENDVTLAKTTSAHLIAFRVQVPKRLKELAEKEGVGLLEYWIIYDALEFLQEQLKKIATPVKVVTESGRFKVLALFSKKGDQAIIGGEVAKGELKNGLELTVTRNKEEVGVAKITQIKVGKVDTDKAEVGTQCGLSIEGYTDIEVGDVIVASTVKYE
ncbi:MAG: translation initiation factor IF-2 [Patescibacteria group bacterium]